MSFIQSSLDFNGDDHELQLRLRWAENAARQRAFWTRERACLSWMQGTTPHESDMAWWNAQPSYTRDNWLELMRREQARSQRLGVPRRPFHEAWNEWNENIEEGIRQDEERIAHYMEILREDFLHGRTCSLSFECDKTHQREHSERLLRIALERLAIPAACMETT